MDEKLNTLFNIAMTYKRKAIANLKNDNYVDYEDCIIKHNLYYNVYLFMKGDIEACQL